jgi:L-threonylcarbamoyladenylate synthase
LTDLQGVNSNTSIRKFVNPSMTEVLLVDPNRPDPDAIARAADCLRRGGLVAFPTETVYGLGAHALDRAAIARVFEAKGRPPTDPLIVHVATLDQAVNLVTHVPDVARALAQRFWPGPLTLVLPRAAGVPPEVAAGLATVAIRVPAHPVARALLEAARLPVAAPSANLFSRPSPTRASHVLDDLGGHIDMVLDGGPTAVGVESTVLDLTVDPPLVLRPGAVSLEALRTVLPGVQLSALEPGAGGGAMPSPGLLAQHYAPRTPMTLYEGDPSHVRAALLSGVQEALAAGQRVGALATSDQAPALRHLPIVIAELGSEQEVDQVAARLYAALRELDRAQLDVIVAADVPHGHGLWPAVRDRLRRASSRVIRT